MKKILQSRALLIASALIAAPSFADDLSARKVPPTSQPKNFTWTGFYLGFNGGYTSTASAPITLSTVNLFDHSGGEDSTAARNFGPASAAGASGIVRARLNGFLFGGQAGYNWQFAERLIAGLEADVQGAGVRGGNGQLSIYPATNGYAGTSFKLNRQLEFLSTARGRVGYAVTPTLLIYVTGGFAFGGANLSGAVSQSLRPGSLLSDTIRMDRFDLQTGWTIGAGGEMALGHNLSAKLEYLFYDLGQLWLDRPSLVHEDYSTRIPIVVDATGAHTRYDGHILRIGLNYRLDSTIPQTSGSAATPLFASPQFVSSERPRFGDWNLTGKPYLWAINLNGTVTLRGHALGADATVIDAITRSANLPLAFMGRAEASNGPFWAYGDLAWVQLRFAGSALSVRSPLSDVSVSASVSGRLKTTLAIGEAGAGYELGRWKLVSAPASFTAIDAYAGFRYVNMTLDFDAEAIAGVTSPDFQRVGGRSVVRTGAMWWMDPVVGLRMRHSFAPGNNFEFRGDIGGFGAGSKFSWQVFGGYSADFHYEGVNFTTLVGYRALGVNFSQWNAGRENGIDSIIHGPLTGVGVKF